MRVIVTGGAGYIGSHTVRQLVQAGHEVLVVDNLVYGNLDAIVDEGVDLVVGNLGDREVIEPVFDRFRPDVVVHFAAYAYVGESVSEPLKYYQNNLAAPIVLLEVMRDYGCRRFILSSTCATYGTPETLPISEEIPQNPINPYGHSKRMLEQVLSDCDRAWGLKFIALRYFNACGASLDGRIGEKHDPETHLIPRVFMAAQGEIEAIDIYGDDYETPDGTCIRDYIHVEDLAAAHLASLEHLAKGGASDVVNLGTGKGISVNEIVAGVEQVTGKPVPRNYKPRRAGDPPRLIADAAKADRVLGWTAQHSDLQTILQTAWNWFRKEN